MPSSRWYDSQNEQDQATGAPNVFDSSPRGIPQTLSTQGVRMRSASPDHQQHCIEQFGSLRAARRACARCCWMANRSYLLRTLVYTDTSGQIKSWISENPNLCDPWGLGCSICNMAREKGHITSVPESPLSEFKFGS